MKCRVNMDTEESFSLLFISTYDITEASYSILNVNTKPSDGFFNCRVMLRCQHSNPLVDLTATVIPKQLFVLSRA